MSKTDKTRPHWVKIKEHPREVHNHVNGVCEIALGIADVGWGRDTCYTDAQWWRHEFRCGCDACTGLSVSKKNRRAARKQINEEQRLSA